MCSIGKCESPVVARGWCRKHYNRWYEHGNPLTNLRERGVCSIEECERLHKARGWCQKHYERYRKTGNPFEITPRKQREICEVRDCLRTQHARGWCSLHYKRWQSNGNPLATQTMREHSDYCSKEGCLRSFYCKGLCESHYRSLQEKSNIHRKLSNRLRQRMYMAVRNNQKSGSAVRDLGCSISVFKLYIENQFKDNMTWDNWGKDGWHLDHVLPLASFDLTNRMEFLEAANWLNYQPLWATENLSKGSNV